MLLEKNYFRIKYIDELGICYQDIVVDSYKEKLALQKEWLNKEKYSQDTKGDMQIIVKDNGQELWAWKSSYKEVMLFKEQEEEYKC